MKRSSHVGGQVTDEVVIYLGSVRLEPSQPSATWRPTSRILTWDPTGEPRAAEPVHVAQRGSAAGRPPGGI